MRIVEVRASVHQIDGKLPVSGKPAGDTLRVVCEIETDAGLVGLGMTGRFLAHGTAAVINHHLAPAVMGLDPRRVEAVHARMAKLASERGRMSGINLAAMSCIDLACWDLWGKSTGQSVAQLLGGHADGAEVYVTFGFPTYDDDQLVEVARLLVAEGHHRLKVLVGTGHGGRADVRRVRKVREAVGDDVVLSIDANEGIPLEAAVAIARGVEALDIAWFEDPLRNCDARDMAELRRKTMIPLSAGQMDGHGSRFRDWLEHDALDICMPNSMYNGGMTETRRVASLAQIYNRPLSDAGGGGVFCLHHVAGFAHGTLAEVHLGADQVEAALFHKPPTPVNGRTTLPAGPGWGVELDRDRLRATRVQPT
ncbi:MAG: mandelate racemase/muconate lactonizing enzyme family protein [Geminicoccaceae bacterium]|nr:MAG: mandelate racemase/muconate lactonizing enzyme family protein [Geminicoccaceae bacterium]